MSYNVSVSDFSSSNGALGGFLAAIASVFLIFFLIIFVIAVVIIIAQWKAFTKGGKPGWAAIVPFYNNWVLCEMVGLNPYWVLVLLVSGLLGAIPVLGSLLVSALSLYFAIVLNVSVARSFGKSDGFAVGLILLPIVFWPILGFGKDKFVGAKPMNDPVMEKLESLFKKN